MPALLSDCVAFGSDACPVVHCSLVEGLADLPSVFHYRHPGESLTIGRAEEAALDAALPRLFYGLCLFLIFESHRPVWIEVVLNSEMRAVTKTEHDEDYLRRCAR